MNTDYFNRNSQPTASDNYVRLLRQVMSELAEIKSSLSELILKRDAIAGNIRLNSKMLELMLEVSDSTLYRWRVAPPPNNLPYLVQSNGRIYYDFDEVLKSLRKGQLNAKGFNRMKAIANMEAYRNDLINTKGHCSWFITDK